MFFSWSKGTACSAHLDLFAPWILAKLFSADYGFQNKHAFGLSWMQRLAAEKKKNSACGCILSCLFLGFFSSDSSFISQDWSLQLNVHPVYIMCNKPRDSHTACLILTLFLSYPTTRRNSYFFFQSCILARKPNILFASAESFVTPNLRHKSLHLGHFPKEQSPP